MKECLVRKAVVAVGVAALAAGAFAGGGWELLPIYGGGRILDVFFTRNPKVVYAVSDVGGPYRTDAGGSRGVRSTSAIPTPGGFGR